MIPQERLKHLVTQIEDSVPLKILQRGEDTVDEVMLEFDREGTRYYLVRCRPQPKNRILLSAREKAIAKLVAQGLPNKCIGNRLNISPWTVATYLRRIFIKLGVTSRTAMITKLLEKNLLQDN